MHEESEVPISSIVHRDGDRTRYQIKDRIVLDLCVGRFTRDVYLVLVNRLHDVGLTLITRPLDYLLLLPDGRVAEDKLIVCVRCVLNFEAEWNGAYLASPPKLRISGLVYQEHSAIGPLA